MQIRAANFTPESPLYLQRRPSSFHKVAIPISSRCSFPTREHAYNLTFLRDLLILKKILATL